MKNVPKWDNKGKSGGKWDMLLGQFVSLVRNSRMGFPKKFRETLGDKLIVTKGFEKSLIVVGEEGWKALLEGTEAAPFINKEARQTQRFLLGGAAFIELDEKSRFILPEYLRLHAGIAEEAVFVGMSRFVEIWDKNEWEAYSKDLQANISEVATKLIENGRQNK